MKGLVAACLKVEHAYYQTVGDLQSFLALWAEGGVLCSVDRLVFFVWFLFVPMMHT